MKFARATAWCLFTVWAVWLVALQGWLGAGSNAARWMPDLCLVLSLSLLSRIESSDLVWLALLSALARATFSIEPVFAVLAGTLGILGLGLGARAFVETSGPLWRALVCGALVLAFDAWLVFVHRLQSQDFAGDPPLNLLLAWRVALTSALFAWIAGPALVHLPGLTPLRRRRW